MFVWFFLGFLGLGREPPLLAVGARAGSGRGAGLGRVGAIGDAPRGCTPDWRTSAPSPDRGRVSLRGSRAGRSAALFGVWRKTRPSFGGSPFSPRREGSRAGSRATRGTAPPRRSRGIRGGRTGGVRFGGWRSVGRGAANAGAVPLTFARARRGRTPLFPSAQLARHEWTRGFETEPASTGGTRPAGRERQVYRRERGHLATFLTPRNL